VFRCFRDIRFKELERSTFDRCNVIQARCSHCRASSFAEISAKIESHAIISHIRVTAFETANTAVEDITMQTRQLGTNGPHLSEIGFGAWAIGGSWEWGWGPVDDHESIEAIHRSLDVGVNWIDTAAVYGLGHSEEVVARALVGKRDNVFLATKCGMVWDDQKHSRISAAPASIRREIEQSLRRLQTDHVDLYQIHWPDRSTPVEESWMEMVKIRDEGKARYIGVCNYTAAQLDRCEKIAHVQSLQPIYNMIERAVETAALPWCSKHGTGIVAYSPMQSGLLTDTFDVARLAPDDWRLKSDRFKEPALSRAQTLVERLRPIAKLHRKTVGQLAVAWVLRNSAVTSAIVGARRPSQAIENIGGAGWQLSDADMQTIDNLLQRKSPSAG
jgi:aryl-alcohol dehydrogenase-like predicted oxidoreductase